MLESNMSKSKVRVISSTNSAIAQVKFELFSSAYIRWKSTLEEFGFKPEHLFKQIELVGSWRAEQGEYFVTWIPKTDIVVAQHKLQKGLDENHFQKAVSRVERWKLSKGDIITAGYLWEARENPELTAAILIESSLFARMGGSRGSYPKDNWPPRREVQAARKSIQLFIEHQLPEFDSWPALCTDVIPVRCEDWGVKLENTYSLWRTLAEEHARLYCNYQLLKIGFVDKKAKGHIS
jgi:hypothetical protein